MTVREMVNILESQGHSVQYYIRKDGGLLIKKIDEQKFQGASGNQAARRILGQSLSTKRAEQLHRITYTGKRAKSIIDDRYVKNLLRKVQRKWRKAFPHKKGEFPDVGLKTSKKVKWSLENRGREETIRLLTEAERYAEGRAYTKNVEQLVQSIQDYARRMDMNQDLFQLAWDIRDNAWMIMEEMISPIYETLYKLNDGVPVEEVIRNVRKIIKIPPSTIDV